MYVILIIIALTTNAFGQDLQEETEIPSEVYDSAVALLYESINDVEKKKAFLKRYEAFISSVEDRHWAKLLKAIAQEEK